MGYLYKNGRYSEDIYALQNSVAWRNVRNIDVLSKYYMSCFVSFEDDYGYYKLKLL